MNIIYQPPILLRLAQSIERLLLRIPSLLLGDCCFGSDNPDNDALTITFRSPPTSESPIKSTPSESHRELMDSPHDMNAIFPFSFAPDAPDDDFCCAVPFDSLPPELRLYVIHCLVCPRGRRRRRAFWSSVAGVSMASKALRSALLESWFFRFELRDERDWDYLDSNPTICGCIR